MTQVERVKEICKKRGISIHKLEMACGFANGYISQLKKGVFPMDRAAKIANYFNVSLDYLMGKTDDSFVKMGNYLFNGATGTMIPFKDDKLDYVIKTQDPDVEELVQNFNRLPEDLRHNFLNLVKATAKDFEDKP